MNPEHRCDEVDALLARNVELFEERAAATARAETADQKARDEMYAATSPVIDKLTFRAENAETAAAALRTQRDAARAAVRDAREALREIAETVCAICNPVHGFPDGCVHRIAQAALQESKP